jgi:hypothetical protein
VVTDGGSGSGCAAAGDPPPHRGACEQSPTWAGSRGSHRPYSDWNASSSRSLIALAKASLIWSVCRIRGVREGDGLCGPDASRRARCCGGSGRRWARFARAGTTAWWGGWVGRHAQVRLVMAPARAGFSWRGPTG